MRRPPCHVSVSSANVVAACFVNLSLCHVLPSMSGGRTICQELPQLLDHVRGPLSPLSVVVAYEALQVQRGVEDAVASDWHARQSTK